jgi:SAM-dependent methyltransferase
LAQPHNWLIHRVLASELRRQIGLYAQGRLVDIGCGEKPYRDLVAPFVAEHIGVDHGYSPHGLDAVDIVAPAYDIPLPSGSVDTVLCTDVLEHLEEPGAAVREAARLLRPGGHAIYSVPLFWHLHEEPRDFFRFTSHGLRYLFEAATLEVVTIVPLSGFVLTFAQELSYFMQSFARGSVWNPSRMLVATFCHVVQVVALVLNRIDPTHAFSVEYVAVARKSLAS